jgi:hypothetical protein
VHSGGEMHSGREVHSEGEVHSGGAYIYEHCGVHDERHTARPSMLHFTAAITTAATCLG